MRRAPLRDNPLRERGSALSHRRRFQPATAEALAIGLSLEQLRFAPWDEPTASGPPMAPELAQSIEGGSIDEYEVIAEDEYDI